MKEFEKAVQEIGIAHLQALKSVFEHIEVSKSHFATEEDEHTANLELLAIANSIDRLCDLLNKGIELGL